MAVQAPKPLKANAEERSALRHPHPTTSFGSPAVLGVPFTWYQFQGPSRSRPSCRMIDPVFVRAFHPLALLFLLGGWPNL